jgi:lysophospholipid acyltransferase (LPLAT)-like uncharacterized protein
VQEHRKREIPIPFSRAMLLGDQLPAPPAFEEESEAQSEAESQSKAESQSEAEAQSESEADAEGEGGG